MIQVIHVIIDTSESVIALKCLVGYSIVSYLYVPNTRFAWKGCINTNQIIVNGMLDFR